MNGIMKLRIVVTAFFIMTFFSLILSFIAVDIEENEFDEWYYSLSDSERSQMENIFLDYPIGTTSEGFYSAVGFINFILIGGLFILMIKVWKVDSITTFDSDLNNANQQTMYKQIYQPQQNIQGQIQKEENFNYQQPQHD